MEKSAVIHIASVAAGDACNGFESVGAYTGALVIDRLSNKVPIEKGSTDPTILNEPGSSIDRGVVSDVMGATISETDCVIGHAGGRMSVAEALGAESFRHCRNVTDGCEGPLESVRHNGQITGREAAGPLWLESMVEAKLRRS